MCTALYTQVRSLLADKRVTLETAPEAIEWLADVGFDPRYYIIVLLVLTL
jgi:C-terminal, D2-small domain, of ClpB protein